MNNTVSTVITSSDNNFGSIIPETKPLEYYLSLTKEQLQVELEKWEDIYKLADLNQYTLKILMNASYGSLSLTSNPFSAYGILGSSITSTGRFYNRWVAYKINVHLNDVLKLYSDEELLNLPFTIQADTDTVSGDSILYFEDKKITIKEFFDTCIFDFEEHTNSGKHIKHINKRYKCLSLSKNYEKQFQDVSYVMAHKVEKKYYKVRVRSDEVIVTEDHGLMVSRDGNLIEVKPSEVLPSDKFIRLKNEMFSNSNIEQKCKKDMSLIDFSVYDLNPIIEYDNIRNNFKEDDERNKLSNGNLYYYSHKGLIAKMYQHMVENSRSRGMNVVLSRKDFVQWLSNNNFRELYQNYWNSNFNPMLVPSINRLDDLRPYTYKNMELNTFEHNINYQKITDYRGYWKSLMPILQLDKENNALMVYNSTRLAASNILNKPVEEVTKRELDKINGSVIIDKRYNKYINNGAYGYNFKRIDNDLDFVSSDDFEIIDLGICCETVYDIEVKDNHNFFANNILVHNSSYNLMEQICDKYVPQANSYERIVFAQNYFDEHIMTIVKDAIDEVSYTLNVRHPEVMKMDQETTTSAFISVAPKRYYLRNHYKEIEGKIVIQPIDKPKLKITGLSVIGKSTPIWSKKRLKPLMELILDKDEKQMAQYVNDMKKEIYSADIISVCQFKNVSKVNFDMFEDNKFLRYSDNGNLTTVGGHGKGALWYNKFIFDNQLTSKYSYIKAGDIVKVLPLYKDNPLVASDTIAFLDIKFITEMGFDKYIDFDTLFDKIFVSNVNIILKPLKWEIYNVEEDLMSAWGF